MRSLHNLLTAVPVCASHLATVEAALEAELGCARARMKQTNLKSDVRCSRCMKSILRGEARVDCSPSENLFEQACQQLASDIA